MAGHALRSVVLITLAVLFVLKGMQKVPSGNWALRLRFGKVVHRPRDVYNRLGYTIHGRGEPKMVGPGLAIGIPFVHTLMIESITEQIEPLEPITRFYPVRQLACYVNFKVVNLEHALVDVKDYKELFVKDCAAVLRRMAMDRTLTDDDLSMRMLADEWLQQRADHLGVRLLKLTVSSWKLVEPAELLNGPYGLSTPASGAITRVA